jgi:2Fe-2S ferredoxin
MARIMIENLFKRTLEVTDHSKTLLRHFQDHRLDWMQACGGKGRCTTCRVIITSGMENLQPLTGAERKYRQIGALADNERLTCQASARGDVSVIVPLDCKLSHVQYSDEGRPAGRSNI